MAHWLDTYYPRGMGAVMPTKYVILITQQLRAAGIPEKILPYALAQVAFETDGGLSQLATYNNNWSGIKYTKNSPYAAGIATTTAKASSGFAKYNSVADWAKDYRRVLSMGSKPPIAASSANEFYHRLADNGYFTKGEAAKYLHGFNARLKEYAAIVNNQAPNNEPVDKAIAELHPEMKKDAQGKWKKKGPFDKGSDFFHDHPILAGVGMAVVGVVVLKTISK